MKLILKKDNQYEILPHDDSNWIRVTKADKFLALCMDKLTAFQVIYKDVGDGKFLSESDFEEVLI